MEWGSSRPGGRRHGDGRRVMQLSGRGGYPVPELVRADQLPVRRDREDERAAIGVRTAARIPVAVGHRTHLRIFVVKAGQRRVDGLLLRRDDADGDRPLLQGEHLGAQHRGVRDADELPCGYGYTVPPRLPDRPTARLRVTHAPCNDEEPWTIGG